jgi:hypothetical protein
MPSLRYPLGPPLIGALLRMPLDAVVARILARLHEAGLTELVPPTSLSCATPARRTAARPSSPPKPA